MAEIHPVTANLNEIFFAEPGALSIIAGDRVMPIITTTQKSGGRISQSFSTKQPEELAADFQPDGKSRVIAAALRGPFESAFDAQPKGDNNAKHRSRSTGTPRLFVVADVDWIFDPFALQKVQLGERVIVRPLNDNLTLLLNMIEYASGDPALIAIRSRGRLQRPFTKVADLLRAAQEQYRKQESEFVQKISNVESEIAKIPKAVGGTSVDHLPENIRAKIRELRHDLLPIRRNLREIRLKIRSQVDSLGRRLTLINLLAGPLLVSGFGALVMALRRRRRRKN